MSGPVVGVRRVEPDMTGLIVRVHDREVAEDRIQCVAGAESLYRIPDGHIFQHAVCHSALQTLSNIQLIRVHLNERTVVVHLCTQFRTVSRISLKAADWNKRDRYRFRIARHRRIRQVLGQEFDPLALRLRQSIIVENQAAAGGSCRDIVLDTDTGSLKPESIASMAEVVRPLGRMIAGTVGSNRQIPDEGADLIASFCHERCAADIMSHVVCNLDIAGMIDEPPSRTAHDRTTGDSGRTISCLHTITVKMHAVSPHDVGSGAFSEQPVFIQLSVVGGLHFVRATKFIEAAKRH